MINILVNDKSYQFEKDLSIKELIDELEFKNRMFVVALNGKFVSMNDYSKIRVEDGDSVEILEPMSGG